MYRYLEFVALDLKASQTLVAKGIDIDAALSWYDADLHGSNKKHVWKTEPGYYGLMCPAPTLSELMEAIRQKYPDAELDSECIYPDARWQLWTGNEKGLRSIPGPIRKTVIGALAALCEKVLP